MVESLTLTVDFKNAALIAHITELHKAISRIATEYDRIDLKQCDTSTLWRFAGVSRAIGMAEATIDVDLASLIEVERRTREGGEP